MSQKYACARCGLVYTSSEYLKSKFCPKCGTFLQGQKPPRGKKFWIFQANPETFRIFDWWNDHHDDNSITWSIRQYADEVRKGDQGVIWISGNNSGIYAVVEVETTPSKIEHTEEEKSYWIDSKELFKITKRSVLVYQKKLFDQPISRSLCRHDEVLSSMSILRQAQGTVFRMKKDHFNRIHVILS